MAASKWALSVSQAPLLGSARHADHAAAVDLRDLTGDRTGRAGGAGDDHGVPLPGLAHVEHAEVARRARHPEHRERELRIRARSELAQQGAAERPLLPAGGAHHEVAGGVAREPRLHHLAHGHAPHHLAEADGRDVVRAVLHPSAHRRLEGEPAVAHEDLALAGLGHRRLVEGEVVDPRAGLGTAREAPLSVRPGHGILVGSRTRGERWNLRVRRSPTGCRARRPDRADRSRAGRSAGRRR